MFEMRPVKGRGGIGGHRREGIPKKVMKQVSPKQRKRTNGLHDKLENILKAQDRIYGKRICEASKGHEDWKFRCPSLDGRYYGLVFDHVETRNEENADRYANGQALCTWCNFQKGSVRGLDFRSPAMKAACEELDRKGAEEETETVEEDLTD